MVLQYRNANKTAVALCADDFVKHIDAIEKIGGRTDWESPQSIDFDRLMVVLGVYEKQFDAVILEGHLVFCDARLLSAAAVKYFLVIPEAVFRQRRAAETRWGEEPTWFIDHVWESFLRHGQPPEGHEIIKIAGH